MSHSSKLYNFICSADENHWEQSPTSFYKYRLFEYTDHGVFPGLESDKKNTVNRLLDLPTLFVYEDFVGKMARVGSVTQVRDDGDDIRFAFEFSEDFAPISNANLAHLSFELEIDPFEFSRTHWAVKQVDLLQTLEQRGYKIPKLKDAAIPVGESGGNNTTVSPRTRVFISYSHADAEFLERLRVHLKPLQDRLDLEIWSDTKLIGGDDWKAEIEIGLANASVAILIISADFLASDFVTKFELPPLLEKHEKHGCRIIPVVAKPCFFSGNPEISRFQSVNDPKDALQSLTEAKREEIFAKVTQLVHDLAS